MDLHLLQLGLVPVVLATLHLFRRRRIRGATGLVREVRDLLTLRMVLRDSEPEERGELLAAHQAWRAEGQTNSARAPRPRQAAVSTSATTPPTSPHQS